MSGGEHDTSATTSPPAGAAWHTCNALAEPACVDEQANASPSNHEMPPRPRRERVHDRFGELGRVAHEPGTWAGGGGLLLHFLDQAIVVVCAASRGGHVHNRRRAKLVRYGVVDALVVVVANRKLRAECQDAHEHRRGHASCYTKRGLHGCFRSHCGAPAHSRRRACCAGARERNCGCDAFASGKPRPESEHGHGGQGLLGVLARARCVLSASHTPADAWPALAAAPVAIFFSTFRHAKKILPTAARSSRCTDVSTLARFRGPCRNIRTAGHVLE